MNDGRKVSLITTVLSVILFAFTGVGWAVTVVLYASDDASVNNTHSSSGEGDYLGLGGYGPDYQPDDSIWRTFLKFDLSPLPSSACITVAYVCLDGIHEDGPDLFAGACSVEDDSWTEATITWGTAPTEFGMMMDRQVMDIGGGAICWYVTWDVSAEHGGDGIYSVVIKEEDSDEGVGEHYVRFVSNEHPSGPWEYPRLVVTYDEASSATQYSWGRIKTLYR